MNPKGIIRSTITRIEESSPLLWAAVVLIGVVVGTQFNHPNKRVLEACAGGIVAVFAFRFHLSVGLSVLVFFLPFPTAMSFGSTNTVFAGLLFIVWLARISLGHEKPPSRTPLDMPIVLLLMAYMTSSYNSRGMSELMAGLVNFASVAGCVLMYYLIVNFVNDERALKRIVVVASISCATVLLTALYELFNPGKVLLPGWILGAEKSQLMYVEKGLRVGGSFGDYELLAEYSAINLPLQIFMAVRAKSISRKIAWLILAAATTIVLHATITRGAFIAFYMSMAYLMLVAREDFDFKKVVAVAILAVIIFVSANSILVQYTKSGSVFARFSTEKTFAGVMPAARAGTWTQSWERSKEHIVIGHGPYFSLREGVTRFSWPHNTYLFQLYITGLFGLSAFLWLLIKLFAGTLKFSSRSLASRSFSKSLLLVMNVQLLIFMIDELKIDFQRNVVYTYYVWFLFGLMVACLKIAQAAKPEGTAEAPS
ncbi:MAG: O-antigen ligase family protein [Candidatus Eisenbacteria bacterium]|nr:O-antigen ligase family protein [Candidatus Eisenbacteria bacterium]